MTILNSTDYEKADELLNDRMGARPFVSCADETCIDDTPPKSRSVNDNGHTRIDRLETPVSGNARLFGATEWGIFLLQERSPLSG